MPRKCCVPGCKSNNKSKGVKTKYVSCYSFPKEQALRDKWLQNISRKDWTPSQYSCVCCKHFEPDCFISEVVYNNSKGEEKRFVYDVTRLKPGSYPTIFNDPPSQKFSRKRRDSKSMDINKWRKVIHQKSSIGLTVKDEISNSSFVENNEENVMIGTNNTTPKPAIEPPVFVDVSGLQQEVDDENETENTIGQEDGIANFGIKKEPFDEDSKTWTTNFMDVKVKEEIIEKEEYVVENSASTVVENSEVDYSRPKRKKVLRGYDIYQEYLKMHNGDLSSAGWTLIEEFEDAAGISKEENVFEHDVYKEDPLALSTVKREKSSEGWTEITDPNIQYSCSKCYRNLQHGDYVKDKCVCGTKFKIKQFKCELCDKFFLKDKKLSLHLKECHTLEERKLLNLVEKKYKCEFCKKGFYTKRELSRHSDEEHCNKEKLKCQLCGEGYAKRSQLSKHLLNHMNYREGICEVCGRRFSYKLDLYKHMFLHSGDTYHKCEGCGQCFSRPNPDCCISN